MPHSNLHIQKRRTNRAILIALAAWVVLLFTLTLIKMSPSSHDDAIVTPEAASVGVPGQTP